MRKLKQNTSVFLHTAILILLLANMHWWDSRLGFIVPVGVTASQCDQADGLDLKGHIQIVIYFLHGKTSKSPKYKVKFSKL